MIPAAWQEVFTFAVLAAMLVALIGFRVAADVALLFALALLLIGGVLSTPDALMGFANEGLITVAALYVVAAGLKETGVVHWISRDLLGVPKGVRHAQLRLMLPVASLSAFMNNTPVVAMLVPAVQDWARRHQLPLGQLMMPLSFAAIVGGTCTLVGTSTNLVVNGLILAHAPEQALHLFDIAWVGVPCALVAIGYVLLAGGLLLPHRGEGETAFANAREYIVEMTVAEGSDIAGRTIEEAGLRHLPGMYLAEIERHGLVLPAVGPQEKLQAGDQLIFTGVVDSIVDLTKIPGLLPATDQVFKLDSPRASRSLVEAVVSEHSPVVGRSIRYGRFRSQYSAVVIAVARDGERINQKIGDIVLKPGDMLLLEADPEFTERHRYSRDFMVLNRIEGSEFLRHERRPVALAILAGMVLLAGLSLLPLLHAAILAAGAMIATGCTTPAKARQELDWQVLLIIGASIGLGQAMEATGLADDISGLLGLLGGAAPWLVLGAVYLVTALLTALISNVAAAALMFPLAWQAGIDLGISLHAVAIMLMIGASASFLTPIGYQTNLMVYGPGRYRWSDFIRFGGPLTVLIGLTALLAVGLAGIA